MLPENMIRLKRDLFLNGFCNDVTKFVIVLLLLVLAANLSAGGGGGGGGGENVLNKFK